MKINPSQIARAMEMYRSQRPVTSRAKDKENGRKDEVVLSDKAKAFQVALNSVAQNDDVDHAKVERLRQEIKAGTYEIDSRRIAEKMVRDIISEKGI